MTFTFKHTKFACYCGYIVSAVINNFTPLLFIIFQTDFGITMGQLSFLITLNFGVQMTVDFLGAHFADKIGYKISVVAANIFSAAGLILMGTLPFLMNPFAGLVIAVVTYAVGSGLLEVLVSPIVEALPTDGKSRVHELIALVLLLGTRGGGAAHHALLQHFRHKKLDCYMRYLGYSTHFHRPALLPGAN